MIQKGRLEVYLFSVILAFCSLFYEFVFAHILSVSLGGTKIQYLLIISLFTSALGMGSLCHRYLINKFSLQRLFFSTELLLTLLGSAGPFILIKILSSGNGEISYFSIALAYLIIFLIGFLSGLEVPSLFSLLKDQQGKILAYDYLGMLGASVLFPFMFLPKLGAAGGTLFVSGMNLMAVIWLSTLNKTLKPIFYIFALVLLILITLNESSLNHLLSQIYLGIL